MPPCVRPAKADDYDTLCSLIAQSDAYHAERLPSEFRLPAEPGRSREYFDALLSGAEQAALVAEADDRVVGVVCVAMKRSPRHPAAVDRQIAYVWDLVVDRNARRHGVGRALMDAAEAWGRQHGASECRLTVFDFNDPALAMYIALGYGPFSHVLAKRL